MKLSKIKTLTSQIKAIDSVSVPYKNHIPQWGIPTARTPEEKLLRELHDLFIEVSVQIVEEHRLVYLEDRGRFAEANQIFAEQIRPYLEAAELTQKLESNLIPLCRSMNFWNDLNVNKSAKHLFLHALIDFKYQLVRETLMETKK